MKITILSSLLAIAAHGSLTHAALRPADVNADQTAVQIPGGVTANRPAGQDGLLRYNHEAKAMEAHVNGQWVQLATDSEPAAPSAEPTVSAEEAAPNGSHEFSLSNPLADIVKLKDAVTKIQGQAVAEVAMIKAKIASLEKQFNSIAARLAKIEALFKQ